MTTATGGQIACRLDTLRAPPANRAGFQPPVVSGTRERLHCLRPLPDAADRPPRRLGESRSKLPDVGLPTGSAHTGSAHPHSAGKEYTRGETANAVSQALVGLVLTRTGKGPPKARTAISSDLVIVTLGDCLTQAEQTLVGEGRRALATQFRTALHEGMRAEAVAAVEHITGRHVVAYLTAQQHDADLAVFAFHLDSSAGLNEGS
jgi:uncharacterized protein YbcI